MIEFKDYFNVKRGISITASHTKGYVNFVIYTPDKYDRGDSYSIPVEAFKELRLLICELKVE